MHPLATSPGQHTNAYSLSHTFTHPKQITVADLGQRRVELAWHPDVTLFPMVGQSVVAYQMDEIAAQVTGSVVACYISKDHLPRSHAHKRIPSTHPHPIFQHDQPIHL